MLNSKKGVRDGSILGTTQIWLHLWGSLWTINNFIPITRQSEQRLQLTNLLQIRKICPHNQCMILKTYLISTQSLKLNKSCIYSLSSFTFPRPSHVSLWQSSPGSTPLPNPAVWEENNDPSKYSDIYIKICPNENLLPPYTNIYWDWIVTETKWVGINISVQSALIL